MLFHYSAACYCSPMPVPEEVSPTPEVTVTPEASLTPEGGEPGEKSQVIPKDEPEVSTEEVPAERMEKTRRVIASCRVVEKH